MVALSSIEPRIAALANGTRFSYLEGGEGPALVLLHGIGSAARSWRLQIAGLSDRWHAVAWDAPGYGRSTPLSKESPDAGDYAAALAAFLDLQAIGKCHLVGHSLGSLMAVRFAADYPSRILSLSLSSVAIGHAEMAEPERERLLQSRIGDLENLGAAAMAGKRGPRLVAPGTDKGVTQAVIETMAMVQLPGYAQAAQMLSSGNALTDIDRLHAGMPVQFIYGEDDVITPPAANLKAASRCPDAPVHAIAQAGHALYLEQPERLNDILTRFMEAHDERP